MEFFNLDLDSELLALATTSRKVARANAKGMKKADPTIKRITVRKQDNGFYSYCITYKKPKQ